MFLKDSLVCVILTSCLATVFGLSDPEVKTSNAVVMLKPATRVRVKRTASALTQAEKDDILAKHNEHRKAEPASNMQYMVEYFFINFVKKMYFREAGVLYGGPCVLRSNASLDTRPAPVNRQGRMKTLPSRKLVVNLLTTLLSTFLLHLHNKEDIIKMQTFGLKTKPTQ